MLVIITQTTLVTHLLNKYKQQLRGTKRFQRNRKFCANVPQLCLQYSPLIFTSYSILLTTSNSITKLYSTKSNILYALAHQHKTVWSHQHKKQLIGDVSCVVTDGVGGGVTEDDRRFGKLQHGSCSSPRSMRQINQHSQPVHLLDYCLD